MSMEAVACRRVQGSDVRQDIPSAVVLLESVVLECRLPRSSRRAAAEQQQSVRHAWRTNRSGMSVHVLQVTSTGHMWRRWSGMMERLAETMSQWKTCSLVVRCQLSIASVSVSCQASVVSSACQFS
jgi:uncharacterized protein (UPF0147 family)